LIHQSHRSIANNSTLPDLIHTSAVSRLVAVTTHDIALSEAAASEWTVDDSIGTFVTHADFAIAFGAAAGSAVDDLPGDAFAVAAAFCEDGGDKKRKQGKEGSDVHCDVSGGISDEVGCSAD
jgi:hypothetical protein